MASDSTPTGGNGEVLNQKTFCVVTGASRGIGREIARVLSKKFAADSLLVLMGRSTADLQETERLILESTPGVAVRVVAADLSDKSSLAEALGAVTEGVVASEFRQAVVINNAGRFWYPSRYAIDIDAADLDDLQRNWMLSLSSPLLLTSHVLKTFPKREDLRRIVVYVSSITAIQTIAHSGVYGSGKAAMEKLFKTIAFENPDIRVLSYDPGVADTAMWQHVMSSVVDPGSKATVAALDGMKITAQQTATVLGQILQQDEYESGTRVAYYDNQLSQ